MGAHPSCTCLGEIFFVRRLELFGALSTPSVALNIARAASLCLSIWFPSFREGEITDGVQDRCEPSLRKTQGV